ncbi:MAG: anthrone oxygenase family protein [Pseudomonadota bacterium]
MNGEAMTPTSTTGTLLLFAAILYLVGCFGVKIVCNVPMNERRATMDPGLRSARDHGIGNRLPRWTLWNSVGAVSRALAAAVLLFGLFRGSTPQYVYARFRSGAGTPWRRVRPVCVDALTHDHRTR